MINDLNLTDMETCYKAFRSEVIRGLRLKSERFGFEPEVTAKLAKMRYRIYEVPISYSGRGYEAGKKITWKDGLEAIWCIVKYGFTSDVVEGAVLEETLQKMRGIRRLNEHIFRTIHPWLGRRILEAGSGHGNITDHLLGCGEVLASDVEDSALGRLLTAYAHYDNIRVLRWDMADPLPESVSGGPLDTIVCLNVLEHIADDHAALVNARKLLERARGHLVLLVPAHPSMFSALDAEMGHHRRYSRRMLEDALVRAGFEIEHLQWLNLLGLPGWWLNAKILRRDRLSAVQIGVYRLISRFWLPLERLVPPPLGLSLVAVGRPPASGQEPAEPLMR
jgi:SAM-dependent methyltransferase